MTLDGLRLPINETRNLRRRDFLRMTGATAGTVGLAGCLGGGQTAKAKANEPTPNPIDLSDGKTDDMGGMIIGDHFGPNGQIFYEEHSPKGHDNPAWFHTLVSGLFPYYFAHKHRGWVARVIYVTDYSSVEYEIENVEGHKYISTHTAADTFGDAKQLTYVKHSEIRGGMGKALVPFSKPEDADEFITEYGGDTISFDEIDQKFISEYTR